LSAELEAALLREIAAQYLHIAHTYFRGQIKLPQFELVASRSRLGRWVPATRTVELSRPLVMDQPWGVVLEVLKHEMAHQFVDEVLRDPSETAHGPRFRAICMQLGIDPAASGVPVPAPNSEPTELGKIAERVARLLALAESPNVHEAEAAMAAAQRLLLKHNLDMRQAQTARGYTWRHLGQPTGRTTEAERVLSLILTKHFFVEAIWVPVYRPDVGKRASVLEICGSPENVDIADYVYSFMMHTAARLWSEHKVARAIAGDRDRRAFMAGVMNGMSTKLSKESKRNEQSGLIWVGDGQLDTYFRRRHPHVRHSRYAGQPRTEAYTQGQAAGAKIVIHKGVKAPVTTRGFVLGAGSKN